MPEELALDSNEWQHPLPLTSLVYGHPVQALCPEHIAQDVAPAREMAESAALSTCDERVPPGAIAVERYDVESVCCGRSSHAGLSLNATRAC